MTLKTFCRFAVSIAGGVAGIANAEVTNQANWTVESGGNGHSYRVVAKSSLISWDAAKVEAEAAGGYLATITSAAENAFVFSLIDDPAYWTQAGNDHGPWIGGYQMPGSIEPGGGWTWVTQSGAFDPEAFQYTNWEAGEPNNLTAKVGGTSYNQDRVAFFHTGTGRAPMWSDEYDLTGASLNQWTRSYVIEFGPTPPVLAGSRVLTNGSLQFTFTNIPGEFFDALMTTNLDLPLADWIPIGGVSEVSPGQFQFIDAGGSNSSPRFYRVRAR